MRQVTGRDDIRSAYSAPETAERYLESRFLSAWGSVLHDSQVRVINRVIQSHHVRHVLEIAPGPARLSCEVVGFQHGYLCDANDSMLRAARDRLSALHAHAGVPSATGRWHVVQGDAFQLPFGPPFDMVYTFRFLRHFRAGDRAALYAQIRSLLQTNGVLVFDAVNRLTGLRDRVRHPADYPIFDELYRYDDLVHELQGHGFRVLSATSVIRHPRIQHRIQVLIAPHSHRLAKALIRLLELVPGSALEWIIVSQKT